MHGLYVFYIRCLGSCDCIFAPFQWDVSKMNIEVNHQLVALTLFSEYYHPRSRWFCCMNGTKMISSSSVASGASSFPQALSLNPPVLTSVKLKVALRWCSSMLLWQSAIKRASVSLCVFIVTVRPRHHRHWKHITCYCLCPQQSYTLM